MALPISPSLFTDPTALCGNDGDVDTDTQMLAQEEMAPEDATEVKEEGLLKGEAKEYTFSQDKTSFTQKALEFFKTDVEPSSQDKKTDHKKNDSQFKQRETFSKKEFQHIDLKKTDAASKSKECVQSKNTAAKLDRSSQQTLEKGHTQPRTVEKPQADAPFKHKQTEAKSFEQKVYKELLRKESLKQEQTKQEKKSETKQTDRKPPSQVSQSDKLEKNQECKPQQKQKEEEEGFAEDGQRQHQDNPDDSDEDSCKAIDFENPVLKEFATYGVQESILSQIFGMKVNQFDVLILFFEILKLELKGREQERIGRQTEREMQIKHMENVVSNYKQQSKWQFFSSLGSGVLAIVSGFCPIVGHMKGDWVVEKLGGVFKSMRGMEQDKFFKAATKMTFAMSEMQKSTGQIHNTFAEGERSFEQHMSDLYRTDGEESSRTIEEIKDSWKGIENFLYQSLQMHHDTIRQLYSH